jgi:hypothetical protein
MKKNISQFCLLLAPIVAASVILGAKATITDQAEVIVGPAQWVAFTANLTRVHTNGQKFFGRYYQRADGSTRSESGSKPGTVDVVAIKNVAQRTFYFKSARVDYWIVMQMQLPKAGWFPHPLRMNDAQRHADETIEGFNLVETTERDGRKTYSAPELNFFQLASIEPCATGVEGPCGDRIDQVRLEESADEFFLPPPGVRLVSKSGFGGIVSATKPVFPELK